MEFSQFLHRYVCIITFRGSQIFGIIRYVNSKSICIETERGDMCINCVDINVISEEEALKDLLEEDYEPAVCTCYC